MSLYTQLTQQQRYQIYAFLKAGFSQTATAEEIGVHKSTISRELSRNHGLRGYRPKQAHATAMQRRQQANKYVKLTPAVVALVIRLIKQDFSPEQVSGFLNRHHQIRISHEAIYQLILNDRKNGGGLYLHLRRAAKKRKKRYGSHDRRGQIRDRVSIEHRPAIVDAKSRIGDWEIDTVIGSNHKGVLLTIVERKSKLTLMAKLANRRAQSVGDATVKLLTPLKKRVFTITADNGKEFANHMQLSSKLDSNFYFAHPYHAWERGLNENTNGLIRQYFPKSMCLDTITVDQVQWVMDRLNNRPRKTLGYQTPNEVFFKGEIHQAA